MSIDSVGNFLTIIRNGVGLSKRKVTAPLSKLNVEIAKILADEGFIRGYAIEGEKVVDKKIIIELRYTGGESAIHDIRRVSKPSRRMYRGSKEFSPVIGGLGVSVVTTNKGVMTAKLAKKMGLGGEVICTVW